METITIGLTAILFGGCVLLVVLAVNGAGHRALRLQEIVERVAEVLGNREAAVAWLRRSNMTFGGASPLSALLDDGGEARVMRELERLADVRRRLRLVWDAELRSRRG